jgi:hypothetical protein
MDSCVAAADRSAERDAYHDDAAQHDFVPNDEFDFNCFDDAQQQQQQDYLRDDDAPGEHLTNEQRYCNGEGEEAANSGKRAGGAGAGTSRALLVIGDRVVPRAGCDDGEATSACESDDGADSDAPPEASSKFVDDEHLIKDWARAALMTEPSFVQDVDYFAGECNVNWLDVDGLIRVDTPRSAFTNKDRSFNVPDGSTLVHVASSHAMHVGFFASNVEVDRIISAIRHHLNVSEHTEHFTMPLRCAVNSSNASAPKIRSIGNRKVSYVASRNVLAAVKAARVQRVWVWSIGAKLHLQEAIAAARIDTQDVECRALQWKNLTIDIGTLHCHDPRAADGLCEVSGVIQESSLCGGAEDAGSSAVVRSKGVSGFIPLFTKEFNKYALPMRAGMGKTRIVCNTGQFGPYSRSSLPAGWLSIRPGQALKGHAMPLLLIDKGSVYQVVTGYGRMIASMRGSVGLCETSVRRGLRAIKVELLPALREYALGGFRTEIRFTLPDWDAFVAQGGITHLASSVDSFVKFLGHWNIVISHEQLLEYTPKFVRLVEQGELLKQVETRLDALLDVGVSRIAGAPNSAENQRAEMSELLKMLGIDIKWDQNKRSKPANNAESKRSRSGAPLARTPALATPVVSTPALVNKVIADARNEIAEDEDDDKRKWLQDAFALVRLGGHKTGYAMRRRKDNGGVWCAAPTVSGVMYKLYDMYSEWHIQKRRSATAREYLSKMGANMQQTESHKQIIDNVSNAHLRRLEMATASQ